MKLLMPFAEGFEEIEAMSAISILRSAGISIDMVGVVGSMIPGAHGINTAMDKRIGDIRVDDYDGIVIPGGSRGCANLERSKIVMDAIKKLNEQGKLVAAICAAPLLLSKAGVLHNKKATIYPGMEKELPYPRDSKVVVDGNIITSQGPGTALDFALEIVKQLVGREKADKVRANLLA